jgi:flavin reductase (DIM6/NTAB) family NADH-FMN oxidoreductase RutF
LEVPVDPSEFRRILGHWASGVAVVTSRSETSGPRGLTASAVASVSLNPPLVLVCIDRAADSHDTIRSAGNFAVNVLPQSGERTARRFASDEMAAKFDGIAYHTEVSGAPVLDEALAWVDCRVHHAFDGGDHTIFVGEVLAGDAREGEPLLYYRGGFNRLVP